MLSRCPACSHVFTPNCVSYFSFSSPPPNWNTSRHRDTRLPATSASGLVQIVVGNDYEDPQQFKVFAVCPPVGRNNQVPHHTTSMVTAAPFALGPGLRAPQPLCSSVDYIRLNCGGLWKDLHMLPCTSPVSR